MRKRLKNVNKRNIFSPFRWLDGYLVSWKHWWIAVAITTAIYWAVLTSRQDIFLSLCSAVITVWGYMSVRKYGWLDTVLFFAILPFIFLSVLMDLFSKSQGSGELDYETFIEAALEEVERAFNEVYAGKIIETRTEEEKIYMNVETPYGVNVPQDEMVADIAEHLRISPSHIQVDPISEIRKYYVFGIEAVRDYEESRKTTTNFRSFADIKERMLCKRPATINPLSLRE